MPRVRSSIIVPIVLALLGGTASAECPSDGGAKLHEKGVELMDGLHYTEACPLLEESYRCDETKAGRLFSLAYCRDHAGDPATALPLYDEYLLRFSKMPDSAKEAHRERARVAEERRRAIQPAVPIRVDAGEHTAETVAPARIPSTVAHDDQKRMALDVKPSPRRIAAYALGGVSLAALAAGAVAGAIAYHEGFAVRRDCPGNMCMPGTTGLAEAAAAQLAARVSTVGVVAGLTVLGVATVLFVTGPSGGGAKHGALMMLGGTW